MIEVLQSLPIGFYVAFSVLVLCITYIISEVLLIIFSPRLSNKKFKALSKMMPKLNKFDIELSSHK